MERSGVTLKALYVLLFSQKIYGAEIEMKICTIMEIEQHVSLSLTVFSAGRCSSVFVQCVFSSAPSVCTASVRKQIKEQRTKERQKVEILLRVVMMMRCVMPHWM
ncbi:uncharacterized protein LOC130553143 isoform X4 [Triplophysa rosa]|uniref:uncharacterized protein LOC130553143 isoform X4 n=1 Tax=Triplophysa rosa TaxID=992332 RepID=UPI002545C8C4|nr:uncharacterized protein LOC130553143 isoform X4 [Triplophysa rosa]